MSKFTEMDTAELHRLAESLEAGRGEIGRQLDELYTYIAGEEDGRDSFMVRVADRFREERDQARRELAELKAEVGAAEGHYEAKYNSLVLTFTALRTTVGKLINTPLSTRDQVQSALMLAYEKVRDFNT